MRNVILAGCSEQGLVSKANARRVFVETIESASAHVGCFVNRAPLAFLEVVPGLSRGIARKIVERRKQAPFKSREELRSEGLLTEAQWTSSIAFARTIDWSAVRRELDQIVSSASRSRRDGSIVSLSSRCS